LTRIKACQAAYSLASSLTLKSFLRIIPVMFYLFHRTDLQKTRIITWTCHTAYSLASTLTLKSWCSTSCRTNLQNTHTPFAGPTCKTQTHLLQDRLAEHTHTHIHTHTPFAGPTCRTHTHTPFAGPTCRTRTHTHTFCRTDLQKMRPFRHLNRCGSIAFPSPFPCQ